MAIPILERFWAKVERLGDDQCWIWTAAVLENGYGSIFVDSKRKAAKAHRISWELNVGPIPAGLCVLHKCDVKLCVNPRHLYLGTHDDNMRDKSVRLRIAGEKNHRHKLTASQVVYIRSLPYSWSVVKELAERFGVSETAIAFVFNGRNWKHLKR